MKALAFSDLHDNPTSLDRVTRLARKENPDILISLGDVISHKWLLTELRRVTSSPLICVHGNNDNLEDLRVRCSDPKTHHLHKTTLALSGIKFLGIGGVIGSKPRNLSIKELEELTMRADDFNVLLTHLDPESYGGKELLNLARRVKPLYWLHGHDHSRGGMIKTLGNTMLINASAPVLFYL